MKKTMLFLVILSFMSYGLVLDKVPSKIVLESDNGGTTQGETWSSESLQGKVHTLIYMDPDEREDSSLLLDKLQQLDYNSTQYSTVAIINLLATWMPNALLMSKLRSKQKEMKNMTYVFDKTKYVVKKWGLKDDASNVLVFDAEGKLLYEKSGKLSLLDIEEILALIVKYVEG